MICLAQAVLSQLLISKCCSVMMPCYATPGAARPDSWTPVFHSAKEVLSWIYKRVCGMSSLKARTRIQNREERYFFRVFSTFWSWGRELIPNYCSKLNPSLSFWSGDKRTDHEMAPSSMSIEGKIQSSRQPARSWSLSCGLRRNNSCGRVAWRGENKLRRLRQDADKNQEAFQKRSAHKNPTDI